MLLFNETELASNDKDENDLAAYEIELEIHMTSTLKFIEVSMLQF